MSMLPSLAGLLALGAVLWWGAQRLRMRRARQVGRDLPPTLMGRLAQPLPDYAQILAAAGENRPAPRSLDVTILRTTPGARLRLPKYLVGMPGLLVHMGQVLDRNLGRDAGTA